MVQGGEMQVAGSRLEELDLGGKSAQCILCLIFQPPLQKKGAVTIVKFGNCSPKGGGLSSLSCTWTAVHYIKQLN